MNSNDPNKLACKATPGPWKYVKQAHATKKSGLGMRYAVLANVIDHQKRDDDKWLFQIKLDKTDDLNLHMEADANAHLISAAPEAIEFIADLLVWIDNTDFTQDEVREKIARAEEILKKAYNH